MNNELLLASFVEFYNLEISNDQISNFLSTLNTESKKSRGRPRKMTSYCDVVLEKGQRKGHVCGRDADINTHKCLIHKNYSKNNDKNSTQDNIAKQNNSETKNIAKQDNGISQDNIDKQESKKEKNIKKILSYCDSESDYDDNIFYKLLTKKY